VLLSQALTVKIPTVDYATSDGTATVADTDYVAATGTLTFNPGVVTQTFDVTVNGDNKEETDETYTVTLSDPTNADISTATATGTITNEDYAPTVTDEIFYVGEGTPNG